MKIIHVLAEIVWLSVALHPQGLWDIGTFCLLIFSGDFLIVVALDSGGKYEI